MTLPKTRWLRKFDTGKGAPVEIPLNQQEAPVAGTALPWIAQRDGRGWDSLG